MNFVRPFVNYAIFRELCDRMRFEVDCAKSHHRVISEGLNSGLRRKFSPTPPPPKKKKQKNCISLFVTGVIWKNIKKWNAKRFFKNILKNSKKADNVSALLYGIIK